MGVLMFRLSISSRPTWMGRTECTTTATVPYFRRRVSTLRTIGLMLSMFRLPQCQERLQQSWLTRLALRSHICMVGVLHLLRRRLTYTTKETARCRGLLRQALLG